MINFTKDEIYLICIYNTTTRKAIINDLIFMREFLDDDETELCNMVDSILEKLKSISEAAFASLELNTDFGEEDIDGE